MQVPMVFKAIPFNEKWVAHDKIDIKAIYRRPRRTPTGAQATDPATGLPAWDYTGGLPVRRHADWLRKGFQYVTLASGEDLTRNVVDLMRADGLNPADYIMDPVSRSPWNPALYLATAHIAEQEQADRLIALVEQFGSDAVIAIQRTSNPLFTLPEHLQGIPPGGTVAKMSQTSGTFTATPVEPIPSTSVGTVGGPKQNSPLGRQLRKQAKREAAAVGSQG